MSIFTFIRNKIAFIGGKRLIEGLFLGTRDEVVTLFTDDEITIADGVAKALIRGNL